MISRNKEIRYWMRIFAGLMVIAVVLFAFIDPVVAKGPESLTISTPGIEYQINLMDNNNINLEVKFMEQTGLWYGTGIPLTTEEPVGALGSSFTLAWVNSGPPSLSVEERTIIQHIYLDAEGGPIIHTPAQVSLQDWGSGMTGWFAAPSDIKDTLSELGVPVSRSSLVLDSHPYKTAADTVLAERNPAGYPRYLVVVAITFLVGSVGLLGAWLVKRRISAS
jgi:hypothetical protein